MTPLDRLDHPPAAPLAYAVDRPALRPGAPLWVAVGLVVAGAAVCSAAATRGAFRGEAPVAAAIVVGLLGVALLVLEAIAVLGRSPAAAWAVALPAGGLAILCWAIMLAALFNGTGWDGTSPIGDEREVSAAFMMLAAGLTAIALPHAIWAIRLRRDHGPAATA